MDTMHCLKSLSLLNRKHSFQQTRGERYTFQHIHVICVTDYLLRFKFCCVLSLTDTFS